MKKQLGLVRRKISLALVAQAQGRMITSISMLRKVGYDRLAIERVFTTCVEKYFPDSALGSSVTEKEACEIV